MRQNEGILEKDHRDLIDLTASKMLVRKMKDKQLKFFSDDLICIGLVRFTDLVNFKPVISRTKNMLIKHLPKHAKTFDGSVVVYFS